MRVDVETGEKFSIWRWQADVGTQSTESAAPFIESIAVVDENMFLLGICCEPASGQIWVLDVLQPDETRRIALDGSHPAVSDDGLVAVADGHAIKTIPVEKLLGDVSDKKETVLHYEGLSGADADITWVDEHTIVFDTRSGEASSLFVLDVETNQVDRVGQPGFERPAGDPGSGRFVAVEQCCWSPPSGASIDEHSIVIFDLDGREISALGPFPKGINNVDYLEGLLLVTYTDGEVGLIDVVGGDVTRLSGGMRAAVWFRD